MTEIRPQPDQTPEQRAEELKRRHVETRRRQARRRRTWMAVAVTALVLAVVAGVVVARALGPWRAGRAAVTRLAPSASALSAGAAGAGGSASPLPSVAATTAAVDTRRRGGDARAGGHD